MLRSSKRELYYFTIDNYAIWLYVVHSASLNCYSCGMGKYTLCGLLYMDTYEISVIGMDAGNTLRAWDSM